MNKDAAKQRRTGAERAAILLMTLGESEAAQVLKHMGAKDVQKIGSAMAQMQNISREEVMTIFSGFTTELDNQTSLGIGADEYVRKVLVNALGEDKASNLIDRILLGRNSKGLEALKWMDARAVAEMIRLEHPQIIAIVLAYLDADQSAEVLSMLPENMRADVIMRIATMDGIQPAALSELDEVLEKQFAGNTSTGKSTALGGAKIAANIMNFVEGSRQAAIIELVRKTDEQLSERIQDMMFVFDNLIDIDDRGMQELLRTVPSDRLLLALKGCEPALREKIFSNMSQRAAESMREDLEAKGPVRLSDVEAAQKEILGVARKLAEAGTIALGGGSSAEQYV
ncbi:MAG TPA: flagellar motor switch protein FliG [Steroidobacteraceae bacterium]|jgi:flagellar motor switch protein FliG|nr:flagellar motor switch protein FliG [Steroidobacteraceae bacterium]